MPTSEKPTGILFEDGKELAPVGIISHDPATRDVMDISGIGQSGQLVPVRVNSGKIVFVSPVPPDPHNHKYSLAVGGLPPAPLDIERIPEPDGELYTVYSDIGWPGT